MMATGRLNERAALAEVGGSAALTRWMAFERLEPFGVEAEDWRLARLGAAILNRLRWADDTPAVSAADLMPDRDGELARMKREMGRTQGQQLTPDEYRERERLKREG